MESSAEMRFEQATEGLPAGKFRCCCGRVASLDNAMTVSPNPYAMPVCELCFDEWEAKTQETVK